MRIVFNALCALIALAVIAACGGSSENQQGQGGRAVGNIRGKSWTFGNGEARYKTEAGGTFLEITLWEKADRVPCAAVTLEDLADRLVFLTVRPQVGETSHALGSSPQGTYAAFFYPENDSLVASLVTAGSSRLDEIAGPGARGRLDVAAGSDKVSGSFSVTICN